MSRRLRRALRWLVLLGILAGILGNDGTCTPTDPVVTLESLQAQVEVLREELCFQYGLRGATPDLATFDPDCPRFLDRGLTVFDTLTGLEWEKKTDDGGVHDKGNLYTWTGDGFGGTAPNGTAFTVFLPALNNSCRDDEARACDADLDCAAVNGGPGGPCGFAGHRDWRLPKVSRDADLGSPELETIVDCSFGSPCINPVFGPTAPSIYWSATSVAGFPNGAWFVYFDDGNVLVGNKVFNTHVRAVRGGP